MNVNVGTELQGGPFHAEWSEKNAFAFTVTEWNFETWICLGRMHKHGTTHPVFINTNHECQ